eukprot:scaffold33787_cov71-Phaeocystis_antarctica.AAC.12
MLAVLATLPTRLRTCVPASRSGAPLCSRVSSACYRPNHTRSTAIQTAALPPPLRWVCGRTPGACCHQRGDRRCTWASCDGPVADPETV